MSATLNEVTSSDLNAALQAILLPQLKALLASRASGHCMRVLDLDTELIEALARELRHELPIAQVYVLAANTIQQSADPLFISSTKLVELRNPLADGSLRPPLLVFLPPNLKLSAEDSFGIATFEEIDLSNVYKDLVVQLLDRLPANLRNYARHALKSLENSRWAWASHLAQTRFLLTAIKNDADAETLGAALYVLGLIPDFKVFENTALTSDQIERNRKTVLTLTSSDMSVLGRMLTLDLLDKRMEARLMEIVSDIGLEDPTNWTRQIVMQPKNWDLSFDKWRFSKDIERGKIHIRSVSADIPAVTENAGLELQDLIGQQVLLPNQRPKFSTSFEVDPHPSHVLGLGRFTVNLLHYDTETGETSPTGVAKNVKSWKSKRQNATASFDRLGKVEFEEGWYIIRVLPWTDDGDPISVDLPADPPYPNDSSPFYILPGRIEGALPEPRALQKATSLEHARLRLQFIALNENRDPASIQVREVAWTEKSSSSRKVASEILSVRFGSAGSWQIPISRYLYQLERIILTNPTQAVSWRMSVVRGQIYDPVPDIAEWPYSNTESVRRFLQERQTYFAAVLGDKGDLISQASEFLRLKSLCLDYALAYREVLEELRQLVEQNNASALIALRTLLATDTVRILIQDFTDRTREAILLGPTHPLRALWLASWAQTGQQWLSAAYAGQVEAGSPAREAILENFTALNFPVAVPLSSGRIFTAADNVHPFWSLYTPSTELDTRGLVSEVCRAVDLPEPDISGSALSSHSLSTRLQRYLMQHPYVRCLIINAFNPGSGIALANALVTLQEQTAFSDVRFDIRVFAPDPEVAGVADAIRGLLSPSPSITTEAADAFSRPSGNHLFPKLSLSITSNDEFKRQPYRYKAHLSLLFDLFPAAEIGASNPLRQESQAPLYGLIQDFTSEFIDLSEQGAVWKHQPLHGLANSVTDGDDLGSALIELPRLISGAIASVAVGMAAFDRRPVFTISLSASQRELLHNVHDVSDWVFTIDRNIGIEFFDRGVASQEGAPSDYLIDYTPGLTDSVGHRLVITTRSVAEIEALVQPVLRDFGLSDVLERHTPVLLDQLRALSGRLALKLISIHAQQAEVIGLALAKLLLEQQGALTNQIVVPLDDCIGLFRAAKKQADEVDEAITLKRTDLALFTFEPETHVIRCDLVEVKCHQYTDELGRYLQLKKTVISQLKESEEVIRRHYDPHYKKIDRADRPWKTHELVALLDFYRERSARYNLILQDSNNEARNFLTMLESGYSLEFTRSALIFDFNKAGADPVEFEEGVEFYRVGRDVIRDLFAEAVAVSERSVGGVETPTPATLLNTLGTASFIRVKSRPADTLPEPPAKATPSHLLASPDRSVTDTVAKLERPTSAQVNPPQRTLVEPITDPPLVPVAPMNFDILIGAKSNSPQLGLLGEVAGRKVALDLNGTHTVSLFGVQGGGKSYTMGTIIEMATQSIPAINQLPQPLATVVFHYSRTQDYPPEFTSMAQPNPELSQLQILNDNFQAQARGLSDVVLLSPKAKLSERREEYPELDVQPIAFNSAELKASHWRFLMGAIGNPSMYLRHINLIMRRLRGDLTLERIKRELEVTPLSDHLREMALSRIRLAEEYIDDEYHLSDLIRPGRLLIVDLRDEYIEEDEALGLFVVMLQIFSEATQHGQPFNKLVVFDEAHKYIKNAELTLGLVEVVREMRHKGTSIMVASQEPRSVPVSLIELSTEIIMHRFNSPDWLRHIQKANAALSELTPEKMSRLGSGEAYIWASQSTDEQFTRGAVRIRCRPRVTRHGGGTKVAVLATHRAD